MYDLIEKKRSTRKLYTEALIGRGDITVEDAEEVMTRFQRRLESVFKEVRNPELPAKDLDYNRVPVYPSKEGAKHGTAITIETLKKIADAHTSFPDGFTVHPKVMPQLQRRPPPSPRARSTGRRARSSPSDRCCWTAGRFGSPARTAGAARSCSGSPASWTG